MRGGRRTRPSPRRSPRRTGCSPMRGPRRRTSSGVRRPRRTSVCSAYRKSLRRCGRTRRREIQADTEAVWKERHELLEDIRRMSGGLVDLANAATARIQRSEPAGPEEAMVESDAGDEIEPRGIATDESAQATPAGRVPGTPG